MIFMMLLGAFFYSIFAVSSFEFSGDALKLNVDIITSILNGMKKKDWKWKTKQRGKNVEIWKKIRHFSNKDFGRIKSLNK